MMSPLLEVENLHVHFPTAEGVARAVDGVSFNLEARRTLCLVGESGCGKSTTALALLRLQPASALVSGSVRFEGTSLLDLPESRLRQVRGVGIGMIFQEPAASLNPIYTLGGHVAEAVRLHQRLSRRAARARTLEFLRDVRMPEPERVARQYPHEVSGGMRQRALIAMALAGRPRLLLADEPTSALDVTVQAEVLALLRRLREQHGMALLLITHDLDVVAALGEEVAVMYAGKVVEHGPAAEVFRRPLHPYTEGLLGCRPRLGHRGRLPSIDGTVPPATRWPPGCRFRDRCNYRSDRCLQEPPLEEHAPGHTAACWHWEEVQGKRKK
jgi:oligopeptide/dipeptide ABC transporter ATP-binding protein